MLLIEQASGKNSSKSDMTVASRWTAQLPDIEQKFRLLQDSEGSAKENSNELVFDCYVE